MEKNESFGKLVGILANEMSRSFKAEPDPDENSLTCKQRRVLHYIIDKSEAKHVFQRDIEQEFNMRRSSASNMLANMENAGFIQRQSVNYDGRLKQIIVTDKAKEIKAAILQDCTNMEARLVKNISAEDLGICAAVLKKMIKNLRED